MAIFVQEDKISEIKNTVDILEIVSESVALKKRGQNYMGLCPFHSEKTPSFSVNPQRGIYHCFGCGAGGDVISFLMRRNNFSFPEAVKMLAGRYGIELPDEKLDQKGLEAAREREEVFKINKMAMNFFSHTLFSQAEGESARNYLVERGITGETAERFGLGYVSQGWGNLVALFRKHGVNGKDAEKAGLIVSKNNGNYYDRFRNRVIFPIIDISGQVAGFGGRVLDDSLPKYLNSPETTVYNKSRILYGYNISRQACRETGTVYVVEGYFDLIALIANGVENSVATLGTAISRDHIRTLSRGGVKRFVLVFDSDEAGLKAAARSIPLFQKEFIQAEVLVLPEGQDPDSFIRNYGLEAFEKASSDALGVIPFLTESAISKHGLSVAGRLSIIEDLREPLINVDDSIARSLYIRDLSSRIGVDEKAVHEKISQSVITKKTGVGVVNNKGQNSGIANENSRAGNNRWRGMEYNLLTMMIQFPEIIEECRKKNVVGYFDDENLRNIAELVLCYRGSNSDLMSFLMGGLHSTAQREMVAALAIGNIPWLYDKCITLIDQFVGSRSRHKNSLSDRIKAAEESGDNALLIKLIEKKKQYSEQLREKQAHARRRY